MTTTPTASPELPGLDNLETQARAADQDGQHIYTNPRDSDNRRANEIWHYLASPAAVLALIALARRAQPEGEAPQAVPAMWVQYIDGVKTQNVARDDKEKATVESIHRTMAPGTKMTWRALYDHAPAATLSPLRGAQLAATGDRALLAALAEAADVFMKGGVAPLRPLIDRAKAVAAQQAAAPGALPDQAQFEAQAKYQGATDFTLVHPDFARCNNGWEPATYRDPMTELAWRVWANKRLAASAPGTPEAPADAIDAARYRYIRDTGTIETAVWAALEGYGLAESGELDQTEYAVGMDRAIDKARAAQLDGGQEGSESNG